MSLQQDHGEFGVGQNTRVMKPPTSIMKIEALAPSPPSPLQVTPTDLFYVRNHLPVPEVDPTVR